MNSTSDLILAYVYYIKEAFDPKGGGGNMSQ